MPSDCKCTYCNQTGHVDKVCLTKRRETANVSEETMTKDDKGESEKEGGEEEPDTPQQGIRLFTGTSGKFYHSQIPG